MLPWGAWKVGRLEHSLADTKVVPMALQMAMKMVDCLAAGRVGCLVGEMAVKWGLKSVDALVDLTVDLTVTSKERHSGHRMEDWMGIRPVVEKVAPWV